MSTVSPSDASIEVAFAKALGARVLGWSLAPMLVAIALVAVYEAHLALETPGNIIRHELTVAVSELERLPWSTTPSDHVPTASHDTSQPPTTLPSIAVGTDRPR